MPKPILMNGKLYRRRRGKLVEIPPEWAGRVTIKQTRKGRTKEARTRGGPIPWRLEGPASGQDARPEHRRARHRKMMPEPTGRPGREEE